MQRFPTSALASGIAASLLFVAAISLLIGPVASDSPSEMAASLADGRSLALVAPFGAGLSAMLALWFMTALRGWMRSNVPDGGEELGTVTLIAGAVGIGLALVGMSLFYGATYDLADRGGSAAIRGLVDAANAAMMMTKFPGAVVVAAVSTAASRIGWPAWFAKLGFASVAVLLLSAIGLFTTDGFTEFGGPLDFYGTLPAALWSICLMFLLSGGRLARPLPR